MYAIAAICPPNMDDMQRYKKNRPMTTMYIIYAYIANRRKKYYIFYIYYNQATFDIIIRGNITTIIIITITITTSTAH